MIKKKGKTREWKRELMSESLLKLGDSTYSELYNVH